MQITQNHLGMLAKLTVAADMDARDHCVVVVKGTFEADAGGVLRLAGVQCPLVGADEHHGCPDSSSPRYECDFAPYKPLTDVIVVGKAVAPKGQLTSHLPVRLEIDGRCKDLMVYGAAGLLLGCQRSGVHLRRALLVWRASVPLGKEGCSRSLPRIVCWSRETLTGSSPAKPQPL